LEVFGAQCAACGRAGQIGVELVLDHHQPLSKRNPLLHNAVPLCCSCNSRKNDTPPEEFYDYWKLLNIEVLLRETRVLFEARFSRVEVP
jgi:5-methylcytosine-specific restriction endonuclease McrA